LLLWEATTAVGQHVFISYVRDNSDLVLKLRDALQVHGVEVWLDRDQIQPGHRWKAAIRKAISDGAFFIACFSTEYETRSKNFMNEELVLAIDELRLRDTDKAWFIPVLLSECNVPDRNIGAGETLRSIQWVELYDDWAGGIRRILSVIAPTPPPGTVFRDTLKDSSEGPEMVVIPSGNFLMGSPERESGRSRSEGPQHRVTIGRAFAMGRYAVTFDEYDSFANAMGRELPGDEGWGRGNRPVISVSWHDAFAYTKWLSAQTDKSYRLPTEAQWEYAARAGTETRYWWGNEIGRNHANCSGCGSQWDHHKQTAPVGSFYVNPFGLYDTAGNVMEWVQDCWHDSYKGAPNDGSAWEGEGGGDCRLRVLRGGSWGGGPGYLRSANRTRNNPGTRFDFVGFRLAQDL
jgi:formylglycine-generating enzyme required for sulfatase activity